MKRLIPLALLLCALPACATSTWYVRADGGTPTQCTGLADTAYPGSGSAQACAFNDFRYLWSNDDSAALVWKIAGGDTVIVRGCHALATQTNPDNPHCRLGWDINNTSAPPNQWCPFIVDAPSCYNPPIPAGSSGQHTRFLSTCAAAGNCQGGSETNPKLYASNLTQLFGGFGLGYTLNFQGTQYVDFDGFEVTTHNGICSSRGVPKLGGGCSTSSPYSDYADVGIRTDNTTSHVTFQDDYIHGFNSYGFLGPIGGPITMTRVFVGFNVEAGWNFDDGSSTPDAAGSSITGSYGYMIGNGFQEEYPIVDGFPAADGWDDNSGGFGDAWSGQNTELDAFICDHCVTMYNTKDGDIGPHTLIHTYTKTNSISAFNMGQQWKWGSDGTTPQTVTFENNLTVSGCQRMSEAMDDAPANYNRNLSDFCRANGDTFSPNISPGSVWTFANNSFIFNSPTMFNVQCYVGGGTTCPSTIHWFNNVALGYVNIDIHAGPGCCGGSAPALFLNNAPGSIVINSDHNVEFGLRNGSTCGGTILCTDPLFLNEPAQSVTAQSALDVFNTTLTTSSFYPTGSSPMIHAGTTGGPATDYFGVAQTSPATIGAVVLGGTPTAATPTFSPVAGTYTGTQSVTISTTTGGATLCYTADGSTPTANGSGTCTHGTTYSTAVSVASSLTLKAVASESGFLDSAVGSAAYVITAPAPGGTVHRGNVILGGVIR